MIDPRLEAARKLIGDQTCKRPCQPDEECACVKTAKAIFALSPWQTMESAPKDGWHVMLFFADGSMLIGTYNHDARAKKPRPFWIYESAFGVPYCRANPPTHWMPIPPTPER